MNELQVFNFDASPVRIVERDGSPWFVATDICKAIHITNSRNAVARLDEDERNTVHLMDGNRGNKNLNIISESGLYAMILRSDKPEARKFRKWVTSEVLPAIRRRGRYDAIDSALPSVPEAPPLIDTIIDMLRSLNARITANENVPAHVLKYAWNLANVSRDVAARNRAYSLLEASERRSDAELAESFAAALSDAIDGAAPLPGMPRLDSASDRVFLRSEVIRVAAVEIVGAGRNPVATLRRLANGGFIAQVCSRITRYPHHQDPLLKRSSGAMWNPNESSPVRILDVKNGRVTEIEKD